MSKNPGDYTSDGCTEFKPFPRWVFHGQRSWQPAGSENQEFNRDARVSWLTAEKRIRPG